MDSPKRRCPDPDEAKRKMDEVRIRISNLLIDETRKQEILSQIYNDDALEFYSLVLQPRDPYQIKKGDSPNTDDGVLDRSLADSVQPVIRKKIRKAFLKAIEERASRIFESLAELRGKSNKYNRHKFFSWSYKNMMFRPVPT